MRLRPHLRLLLPILIIAATHIAAAAPLRLAILAGDGSRAPAAGVVELLQAELSGRAGMMLVERQQIDQVLHEHELALASPVDATQNIELGRLLAADAFVFVEHIPKSKGSRLRLVETSTGIVLGQVLLPAKQPDKLAAEAADALEPLLGKLSFAKAERTYIGSIECRNESLQNELNPVADALAMLLSTQLSRTDEIILMDREQLQWLKGENTLAGAAVQRLGSAAVALNCGVNQLVGEGEMLRLSVSIEPVGGGEAKVVQTDVPRNDLYTACSAAVSAVLAALGGTRDWGLPGDATAEAAAYIERARALYPFHEVGGFCDYFHFWVSAYQQRISGDMPIVQRLCEAALALAPTQESRWLAANTANRQRSLELFRDYWQHEHMALRERGIEAAVPDIWTFPIKPGIRPWGKDGIERLRPETIQLIRECMRLELACKGYDGKKRRYGGWWGTLENAFRGTNELAWDAEEWVNYVKDLYSLCMAPPPSMCKHKSFVQTNFLSFTADIGIIKDIHYINPFKCPEHADKLLELFQWMQQQGDLLAFYSYLIEVRHSPDQDRKYAAKRHLLNVYLAQVKAGDYDTRDRNFFGTINNSRQWLTDIAYFHKDERGEKVKWQEIRQYFHGFVDPALERGDLALVKAWLADAQSGGRKPFWQTLLEEHTRQQQALAWLDRTLDVVQRHKPEYYELAKANPDWKPPLQCELEGVRARIRGDSIVQEPWRQYSIERLPTETKGSFEKIVWLGDCLLIVGHSTGINYTDLHLFLQLYDVNKRKAIRDIDIHLPGVINRSSDAVSDILRLDHYLYVATYAGGLVRVDLNDVSAEPTWWNTDNQLPSPHIPTMTVLNGKLYCWAKRERYNEVGGKLLELEPRTGRWREILSSRSVANHSDLQSGGPFGFSSISGDSARNCLWLAVQADEARRGLWRYNVADGTAVKVNGQSYYEKLHWRQDKLGGWGAGRLYLFDPASGERSCLVGPTAQSTFGFRATTFCREILILGDHMLAQVNNAASVRLYLANSDDVPLAAPAVDGEEFAAKSMVKIDADTGIIATPKGDLYKITRKPQGVAHKLAED